MSKGRFERRASRAGAGNIKCGNANVTNLGNVFSRGIGQREAYERRCCYVHKNKRRGNKR